MSSPPLVRLAGIPLSRLPPAGAGPDALTPLVHGMLREALPFLVSASPNSAGPDPKAGVWKHKGDKTSPDSAAKVEAWERVVSVRDGREKETWALRRSAHEDKAERGTAGWGEFEACFRREHAEAEDAFTPNVLATHEALAWDCRGVPALEGEDGEAWAGFSLKVEEMRHKIGRPVLRDRTFPVLQLTAAAVAGGGGAGEQQQKKDFVVVSVPVPDFGDSGSSRLSGEKGAQVARYVSVERIRKLREGGDGGKIEWLMATASDAGGVLPQCVQNMAMPGVVWKDVPLFLGWIARERQGGRDVARDGVSGGKASASAEPATTTTQAPLATTSPSAEEATGL
ncbi:putative component of NuA3 histone acetyltransferase complex [Pestalotiopsis sp. IQ-011]